VKCIKIDLVKEESLNYVVLIEKNQVPPQHPHIPAKIKHLKKFIA